MHVGGASLTNIQLFPKALQCPLNAGMCLDKDTHMLGKLSLQGYIQ